MYMNYNTFNDKGCCPNDLRWDRLKKTLLQNVSHEIRTPLNAIMGFATLLKDDSLPIEKKHEYISYINQSGESLLNLVEYILELSVLKNEEASFDKHEIDVGELIAEVYRDLVRYKYLMGLEQVDIHKNNIPSDIPEIICSNLPLLLKLYYYLLRLVIQYSKHGIIEIGLNKHKGKNLLFYFRYTFSAEDQDKEDLLAARQLDSNGSNKNQIVLAKQIVNEIADKLHTKIHSEKKGGNELVYTFQFTI